MNAGSMILAGGRITVDENMKDSAYSNITFKSFKKIKVTGELYPESKIGITPPANWENRDLTENYSDFNEANADNYFFCDTSNYRISPEEEYPEAQLVKRLTSTANGYKVKVTVKMGYGFRNTDNLIALTMLRCSDMKPELPGRPPKQEKKPKQAEKKAA